MGEGALRAVKGGRGQSAEDRKKKQKRAGASEREGVVAPDGIFWKEVIRV